MLKKKQTRTHTDGRSLATSQENTKNPPFLPALEEKKQHKEFQTVSLFLFKTEISDYSSSIISLLIPVHHISQRMRAMQTC